MAGAVFVFSLGLTLGLAAIVEAHVYSTDYTTEQGDSSVSYTTVFDTPESEEARYFNYNNSCPTWFYRNQSGHCVCGSTINGVVRCDQSNNQTSIVTCYGMTASKTSGRQQTFVGVSLYNCFNKTSYTSKDSNYRVLPRDVSLLNRSMCDSFKREGLLCGECQKNHSLAPYTYYIQCFDCRQSPYGWIWYAAIAYGPLTVFFIVMVSCRISVVSGKLTAFVNFSQILTNSINLRIFMAAMEGNDQLAAARWLTKILAATYGIWNLDFFRTLLPPVCLNITILQASALDYGIAAYPLVLIVITFIFIKLHEHNFRLVVHVWKPFHKCFARMRSSWDMKTSTIDAFATFLFLSYIKVLNVSTDILLYTNLYDVNGTVVSKRLYLNASVKYFGTEEHLPYAITAIAVMVLFVFTPLILLALYPLRSFQKCLDSCHLRTRVLTTFVDSVQGCYKDGTDGTRDYRYFSAVYIVVRIVSIGLYVLTLDVYFYSLGSLLMVIVGMLYFVLQPYKRSMYNYVDGILSLNLAMWGISITALSVANEKLPTLIEFSLFLVVIFATGPLVYITVVFLYWIIVQKRLPQRLLLRIRRCLRGTDTGNYEQLEDSYPHRMLFPGEYNYVAPLSSSEDEERGVEEADNDYTHERVHSNLWESSSDEEEGFGTDTHHRDSCTSR